MAGWPGSGSTVRSSPTRLPGSGSAGNPRCHPPEAQLNDVRFGLFFPQFEELADPAQLADLAAVAEEAGWSGFFLWDHMLARPAMAVCDRWIAMAAIAPPTREIRFGAMVTPLARRRPWVLARQAAARDLPSRRPVPVPGRLRAARRGGGS